MSELDGRSPAATFVGPIARRKFPNYTIYARASAAQQRDRRLARRSCSQR